MKYNHRIYINPVVNTPALDRHRYPRILQNAVVGGGGSGVV